MKLQVNEIAPYLPYSVKVLMPESNKKGCKKKVIGTVSAVYDDATIVCHDTVNATPNRFKLILRPLSDLYLNLSEHNEIRDNIRIANYTIKKADDISYSLFELFLKHHFDIFGLIDKGLAVDYSLINK